jgi:predicted  nucleic acid-binding Zn-ribbon protein
MNRYNKEGVDNYRDNVQNRLDLVQSRLEELTINQASQTSNITHIKESVDRLEIMVKEQNGRIRKNENLLSAVSAIGGVLSVVFGGFIAWLFKGKM